MTSPRRRVLRPPARQPTIDPRQQARTQRRQAELAKARSSFKRWLTRLKRATNTVADLHQRIIRLEAILTAN